MPAVVRGGRRQADKAAETPKAPGGAKPAGKGGGRARGAARKGAKPAGKYQVIGSVAVPTEVTAWFAVLMVLALLTVILATGNRAQTLGGAVVSFADHRISSLGINVQNVRLEGVVNTDPAWSDITKALDVHRGDPLALMDLNAVQKSVENVGWVKQATVRRQFPDLLVVTIVQRPRLAVWQYQGKDTVIDDQGQVIPEAHAVNFLNLPLVVGEGANESAADILELMNARPALMQKTYALVRVNTRRWDIHLKNGAIIKLPALNQDQAMSRLDMLMGQHRVLDQGFAEIDLLDPNALQVVPLDSHSAAQSAPSL
ncbi:cell division protein FtsQ/DivIB [Asticcacaulis solisilvae]|uniref:cell division protein FtsQ/DivIB n=1 Tax=Asticcacaulis solisilvae TaxID=1217274 RepID=UPI003FD74EB0